MKLTIGINHYAGQFRNVALFLLFLGAILLLATGALAQDSEGEWAEPANLSQSAGTNDPRVVVDSLGRSHVLWTNSSNSFVYSRAEAEGWSQPISVELPFGTRRFDLELSDNELTPLFAPDLFADQVGNIHALWRDNQDTLFQSRVSVDQIATFEAWSAPQQLAEAAIDMRLAIEDSGLIHLVYIRPLVSEQFPAGVYYRQSGDGGSTWSAPLLLYQSPYFQAINSDQANVQVISGGPDQVVASWENPIEENILITHSGDGGGSWDPITVADRRHEDDGLDSFGPGHMTIASAGNTVHLIWQAGHQGNDCALYHQASTDGGSTWQSKQEILEIITDCSMELWLIDDPDGKLLLIDETANGTYLSAWDGQQWSEPSLEGAITFFPNPLTFRMIDLACKQPVVAGSGTEGSPFLLTFVGCESNRNRDIWYHSAELASLIERIAPSVEPIWQPPGLLTTASNVSSLSMVGDIDDQLHAFWSQESREVNSVEAIYYGRWDGNAWSSVRQVLTSPDGSAAVKPSVVFDSPDILSAVWVAGNPGEILFSKSDVARAAVPAEWSAPVNVPLPRMAATNPNLARDQEGWLYVAYAIALNEDRGIYIATSVDGGDSWLEPTIAFDATEAKWDMVDNPKLSIGQDGTLHLMWIRYGSPPSAIPMSIHYAFSTDAGLTWSEPSEVAEGNILWGESLAVGDRIVHRLWYMADNGIWHDISTDGGITWGELQRLPGNRGVVNPVDMTLDGAGRPHVFAVEIDQESTQGQNAIVRHWTWSDNQWAIDESFDVIGSGVEDLTSAIDVNGRLGVLYSTLSEDLDGEMSLMDIFGSNRKLDLPSFSPTPLPTLTPQPTPMATAMPTQTPAPTPTVYFPTEANQDDGSPLSIDTGNPLIGLLVGIVPAAFVILVAFFVVVRIVRGGRH